MRTLCVCLLALAACDAPEHAANPRTLWDVATTASALSNLGPHADTSPLHFTTPIEHNLVSVNFNFYTSSDCTGMVGWSVAYSSVCVDSMHSATRYAITNASLWDLASANAHDATTAHCVKLIDNIGGGSNTVSSMSCSGNSCSGTSSGESTLVSAGPCGLDHICIAGVTSGHVAVFSRTDDGNVAPARTVGGGAPIGLVSDPIHGELIVGGYGAIYVYPWNAGDSTPASRTISGGSTMLGWVSAVAVDWVHDELFAVSNAGDIVLVFARTADGDVAPIRTITGADTHLSGPIGIAVDMTNDEILVTNGTSHAVTVYNRSDSDDAAPKRELVGTNTTFSSPSGIALDLTHDEFVVADPGGSNLLTFARTATGDTAPLRSLTSPDATNLYFVAYDLEHDNLIVSENFEWGVETYPRTGTGALTPTYNIVGDQTGFNQVGGIALCE